MLNSPGPVWLGLSVLEWRLGKGVPRSVARGLNEKGKTSKEVRLFNLMRGG
jgi:hypothetical protein